MSKTDAVEMETSWAAAAAFHDGVQENVQPDSGLHFAPPSHPAVTFFHVSRCFWTPLPHLFKNLLFKDVFMYSHSLLLCHFFFFLQTRRAPPPSPPNKGLKKFEGRAFFSTLLIDEMFPLPRQLFRPFSLENSQWHPVRFASWFICHISFISLNSLYLSSGSMHLSWAPRQCLQQARSKHILHVTLQLQLAYFTLGV